MRKVFSKVASPIKAMVDKCNELATMAVLFANGNIPIYWEAFDLSNPTIENTSGFVASCVAAGIVTLSRVFEMAKGVDKEESAIPHFSLGAFNFLAAGGSLFALLGGQVAPDAVSLGMTGAFAGWGMANTARGIEKKYAIAMKGIMRPAILWPASDISATISTAGWPFGLVALLKSQFVDRENVREMEVHTAQEFLEKHASWDRILLGSYALAASASHPSIAAGFLMFCVGYYQNGEFDINHSLIPDLKKVLRLEHLRP